MSEEHRNITVGRRKTAVARVYLEKGSGSILVNGREFTNYFPRYGDQMRILEVLKKLEVEDQYDIHVNVTGGGIAGQADAVRLGVARYFVTLNPDLRAKLKAEGFLTRDPRAKERKKYGQKRARKRFQFSKR
ncbi:MAG: 30S ribosomal protein S9 [bacterium]|jgi:small subunit ribosomal protein S9